MHNLLNAVFQNELRMTLALNITQGNILHFRKFEHDFNLRMRKSFEGHALGENVEDSPISGAAECSNFRWKS